MAFGIDDAISNVAVLIKAGIDRIWPDPSEALRAQTEQLKAMIDANMVLLKSQTEIIAGEAKGESWIQRNWRPITMLTFLGLIVGHFLGFEGPNFGPEDSSHLFSLIEIGLGGYIIGRSVEKVAEVVKK